MQKTSKIFKSVYRSRRKNLLEPEAKQVCLDYDIPTTKFKVAGNEADAVKFAGEIGYPVVLKIVSPQIIHKSDVGGVIVNLRNEKEVQNAYRQILQNVTSRVADANILGVLVQEMAPLSTEVIVGAIKDPQFGSVVMFGLGGIFVEVLKDVQFRIAPITEDEAFDMITGIKAYPILTGYRNLPVADLGAIVNILLNTSRLAINNQEIRELDLNPIMVYESGAKAIDARIILE